LTAIALVALPLAQCGEKTLFRISTTPPIKKMKNLV
jgi:hypothetical protein